MPDPFVAKRATCDTCDRPLVFLEDKNRGRCGACREAIDAGKSLEEARAQGELRSAVYQSAKIGDKPWWEAGRPLYVTAYPDLDALNIEAPIAAAAGYSITSIAATDGHLNVGRMAVGFWAAGPLGAALATGRSSGSIIVAWEKRESRPQS